jgi:molybdenum cofactor synthesis domain-containing protein
MTRDDAPGRSTEEPDQRHQAQVPEGTPALIVTVSDGVASGERQDEAGPALRSWLVDRGFDVDYEAVADDRTLIEAALRSGAGGHALLVTTGGTGLTPRDVTPQATLAIVDYEVPGLAEAVRAYGRARTPMADLSRGVVGVIDRALVINVPGSPRAALESLEALEPTLRHALETLAGPFDHGAAGAGHEARPDLPDPDLHVDPQLDTSSLPERHRQHHEPGT